MPPLDNPFARFDPAPPSAVSVNPFARFDPAPVFEPEGRPLTNAQARALLPKALTEAEAPLPPIQHIGDTEPVLDPGTGLPIIVPPQPAEAAPQPAPIAQGNGAGLADVVGSPEAAAADLPPGAQPIPPGTPQGPIGAIASKAAEAWGAEPIGMTEQTADALRRAGVLPVPGEGLQPLKQANEAALRSLAAAWDVFARGGGAGFAAFQETLHQAGLQMGLPPQLARDIAASPEAFFGMPGNLHAERGAFEARNAQRAADMGASGALSDIAAGHPETQQTMAALPTLNRMAEEAKARRQPEVAPENTMTVTARRPEETMMPERAAEAELAPERAAEAPEVTPEAQAPERIAAEPAEIPGNPPLFTEPAAPVEPPPETAGNRRKPITPYEAIPKEPERLSSFIKRMGGVQDVGGDIRHSLGASKFRPGLINKNGLPLDEMTMRAWQSGYFPDFADRPSINDLRDAIDDDVKGRARYSAHDDASVADYEAALAKNNEVDRLAAQHDIPTTGITRDQFYDQLHEKLSVEEQAALLQEQAAAHEDSYKEFETAAKDWYAHSEPAPEGWNAKDFYGQSQARTLKDLEDEYRQQEAAANAAQQRAEGVGEPRPAAADQGAGEEGGGPRPGGAGDAIRAGAETPAADLLGRPLAEPRARTGPEPTIRSDVRQDVMPGMEQSAVQAQAARDAGRGTLQSELPQRPANEGLFAPDTMGQGMLYSFPAMLFDPAVWRRAYGPLAPVLKQMRDFSQRGTKGIADLLAPMQSGSISSMANVTQLANDIRQVQYRYGVIDRELRENFTPKRRAAMGEALDAQSVFEQQLLEIAPADQAKARADFDASGKGISGLSDKERQAVTALNDISEDLWRRMKSLKMVKADEGLPWYFPRQVVAWSEEAGFSRAGAGEGPGGGREIDQRSGKLTTQGPMHREHLTAEETLQAARAKLGQDVHLVYDIRMLPARLAYAERAIRGVEFMNKIEEAGKVAGVNTVLRGDLPGTVRIGDYYTMSNHPAFRRWTGSGWQPIHIAADYKGPLEAVLTKAPGDVYRAAMHIKSGLMRTIMWSPFQHLNVEIGRALPLARTEIVNVFKDGNRVRQDLGYMDTAIRDGISPLGNRNGWSTDPVSIAQQGAESPSRNAFIRYVQEAHQWMMDKAGDPGTFSRRLMEDPHQALLWDRVFDLQMGLYDRLRSKFMDQGFDERVSGVMAAHLANRYAGALPPEHLSRATNQVANLLLFSRSFTLGNLGVIKDMMNGAPNHIRALIERDAGPDVARNAQKALRNKAIGAFVLDVGLQKIANGLAQVGWRAGQLALGAAAVNGVWQAVMQGAGQAYSEWEDKAKVAIANVMQNPEGVMGVFPQHWNEPGKGDRVDLGMTSSGKNAYARLSVGKIGEEFMGYFDHPGDMVLAKLNVGVRPAVESLFGSDSLGRKILKPNPRTTWDHIENAGRVVEHITENLGPVSTIEGGKELFDQYVRGIKPAKGTDPMVSAAKIAGPLTGLFSVSSGFPGGPEAGEVHAQTERQRFDLQQSLPGIRQKILNDDIDGAMKDMTALGVPTGLQRYYIRQTQSPGVTPRQMRQFQMTAPPESLERLRQHAP